MTEEYDPFDEQDGSGVPDGLPSVELEFATLRRFREEMAPYLNYDGFFARTDRPLPRGTTVEFKFVMPEDFILAQGTAVVSWNIEPEGNPDLVPGMALRFGQVGKQSRAVIDELVDFHIATGGDPFDVGPQGNRVGDIPTDSLVGGGAPSVIDSPAPKTRDLPLPPDPEDLPPPEEDILPDWLSGTGGGTTPSGFQTPAPPEEPIPTPGKTEDFDFSTGSSTNDFEVDMVFDNGEKDTTPLRPEEGSFQQMAMAPRADRKPPRDLRLGLIVMAALVTVAVIVLAVTYWLRSSGQEVVQDLPQDETFAEVGVELIDDDDNSAGEAPAAGGVELVSETAEETEAETASRMAAETAARVASELGSEDPEEPADGALTSGADVPGPPAPKVAPTKALATEQTTNAMPPAARGRASRVVDVAATARGNVTTVVIRGNGTFDSSVLRTLRLEDPMRLWVGVSGIETFFKPNQIEVGSSEVDRVRIGYHPEDNPPALYVVLDLAGNDVFLLDTSVQGDVISLTVGRK